MERELGPHPRSTAREQAARLGLGTRLILSPSRLQAPPPPHPGLSCQLPACPNLHPAPAWLPPPSPSGAPRPHPGACRSPQWAGFSLHPTQPPGHCWKPPPPGSLPRLSTCVSCHRTFCLCRPLVLGLLSPLLRWKPVWGKAMGLLSSVGPPGLSLVWAGQASAGPVGFSLLDASEPPQGWGNTHAGPHPRCLVRQVREGAQKVAFLTSSQVALPQLRDVP